MDFELSKNQKMLQLKARDFLEKEFPPTLAKELAKNHKTFTPELWRKIADQGWIGLAFPKECGGAGGSFIDIMIILEEMGRVGFSGSFFSTVVMGGFLILDVRNTPHKKNLLPKISMGELSLTEAVVEPNARWDSKGIMLKAEVKGDKYILKGTKLFVYGANTANFIITATRTTNSAKPNDGVTLFLIDAKSPGLTISLLKTIDKDLQCEIDFNNVEASRMKDVLGDLDSGWPYIEKFLNRAAVAKCCEMIGGAQKVFEMTIEYAKSRVQFGRPIGSFQAVQHHCANMAIDYEASRIIAYQAAWKISQGLSCDKEVAIAKAWVSEAYGRITMLGQQIHGAIAFCEDHDMPLYLKRAKVSEVAFGDADFHRGKIAEQLFG